MEDLLITVRVGDGITVTQQFRMGLPDTGICDGILRWCEARSGCAGFRETEHLEGEFSHTSWHLEGPSLEDWVRSDVPFSGHAQLLMDDKEWEYTFSYSLGPDLRFL